MPPPARPSRRTTVVVAGLALPLATACELVPRAGVSGEPSPTPPPPVDAALVAPVLDQLVGAQSLALATAAAQPRLAPLLTALAQAHAAHHGVLAQAIGDGDVAAALPATARQGLGAVRRAERRLQRHAGQACTQATDGALARALASVAASTAQFVLRLDRAAGEATP